LDAPLLLEAGWGSMCDIVLMVDASRETRLSRARRRGWTEAQFDGREAAQWPIVKKRSAAHVVINNEGTEDELRTAVRQFWFQHIETT
jgi:dephospho-CoA kinase